MGHLFPYIPGQSGFNKRLRALAPQLLEATALLARLSPSFCDRLRLLDSTPVPCAASRETVRCSRLAGVASYGYCRSHHRYFWGFRLYLLCAPDGMPIGFELAPTNAPERVVAAELLERALQPGQTLVCDKGFAGRVFEQLVVSLRARILRPDRRNEPARPGSLGGVRQWVESAFDTLKDQLSLERHGGRTLAGLVSRLARRPLALAAAILHNWSIGEPGRSLVAYDHQGINRLGGLTIHCSDCSGQRSRETARISHQASSRRAVALLCQGNSSEVHPRSTGLSSRVIVSQFLSHGSSAGTT